MGKFSLLFSVRFEHLYFSERCCKHLEVRPSDRCRQLMDNAGIIFKNDFRGIHLFYDAEKIDVLKLFDDPSDTPLHFDFVAYSRDLHFFNYTDLPLTMDDSIFYFDNKNTSARATESIALHQGEFVSGRDLKKIPSLPLQTGLSKKEKLMKPLFLIDIFAKENGGNLLDDISKGRPKDYVVKFKNRETHWKYFLLNELAKADLYIADLHNQIVFEKTTQAEDFEATSACIYRSKTTLPLQEKSEFVFQLKEKNSGSGKILIKRLPAASARQISRETWDAKTVIVSEIFINR